MSNTALVERVMAFEAGTLPEDQTLDLFQELVDTGMAWELQGTYGRTALSLINSGHLRDTR